MSDPGDYGVDESVAIIGLAGRFPGARDVQELWENLVEGRETLSFFSDDELDPAGPDELEARRQPNYVRARGVLEDAEMFDAAFFGINPSEAEVLDPQQRVFMETAWEALETAGYDPRSFPGAIGVFAGMSNNYYFLENLLDRKDVVENVGWLTAMMANEKDYLATRVAYKFDLRGPALNLQTACSTSLVAVATAVQSLLTYQCDMALAGGVSVTLPQKRGYLYQEGGITSPDGHCRPFDERAAGTVFGNGVGIVTLRRLGDAVEDGDTIYAVIKGVGINNDGASKVSFTAPSVDGHVGAIAMAHALADVDPQTISYVEAHGTATPLGDPVEIAGLTQAFRAGGASGNGFCAIGSVKGNVGHLDAAAGVTGLIKTALALHHKTLPPSLHFVAPNPKLELESSPFHVVSSVRPWQSPEGSPRRAGVSSFGVGGTNAHLVLEEAPEVSPETLDDTEQLLLLSARSAPALEAATERLRAYLETHPATPLADVAFTLQSGRRRFSHRRAFVARGIDEAIARLGASASHATPAAPSTVESASVAFLFPGQGAQAVGMARGLYESDPGFRADVDACSAVLRPQLGFELTEVLYPGPGGEELAAQRLAPTAVTQPALFTIEYALAMAWRRLGIEPDGMIGHSVGEFTAACLAGVFTRDDALLLVAERARLMQSVPEGTMLAVRASADRVRELLPDGLEIAAENAPDSTVVSGETGAIEDFESRLAEHEVAARRLATSHAFHSPMMEPILDAFSDAVASTPRSAPTLPWISSLTGDWITPEQAQDPSYWAQQVRRPVLFARGIARLLEDPQRVTLEVGPGRQLTGLAKRTVPDRPAGVASGVDPDGASSLLAAAGALWVAGVELDASTLHGGASRRRVPLPTYPFERKRYWVDRAPASVDRAPAPALALSLPDDGNHDDDEATAMTQQPTNDRHDVLVERVRDLFADLSGMDAAGLDAGTTFLEFGLDSLFLTQAALLVQKTFGVKVSFGDLLEQYPTIDALATHLDGVLPPDETRAPAPVAAAPPSTAPSVPATPGTAGAAAPAGSVERLIAEQLEIMRQQLEMIRGGSGSFPTTAMPEVQPLAPATAPAGAAPARPAPEGSPAASTDRVEAFGPYRPPAQGQAGGLTPRQQEAFDAFVDRYTRRTAGSKASTAENRPHLADPRTAAGFRLQWKEIVYPIVTVRSAGSRLWDVDGNEYVDLTNGFGATMFGHNPDFVREAVQEQLERGIEIGPQTALAGEVARRVAAMVSMERVAFCNTGSEAVTAAIRLARTVSGRDKIAVFAGAYHGIFDEVLVRPAGQKSMPIAPGIPLGMVENVVVLDYASPEALDFLEAHGSELAAVLVEPVQSRRPDLQPREFLHDVRRLTEASGTALVFDELVTGFRCHPGGAQAIFGVRADLATYGKVIGGGLPIGLVAGRHEYLDALDGGAWHYGDESIPGVGVTFFAGTFVRHPLALAAARAVVAHLEASGPELQRGLNVKTTELAARLQAHAHSVGAPIAVTHFSSWIWLGFPADIPSAGLFYAMMRDRGVHVWEGRCWFLTTAHTDADLELVFQAFVETIAEMQAGDLLPGGADSPLAGARRGRDADGHEAWFVPDPARPGKYLQVDEAMTRG
jgi:acyl transferase domain-containing protein/glutamate-1-semialdehyde aminotransferase